MDHAAGIEDSDLLWTTDASGTSEIDKFGIGESVYLRTNPNLLRPLPPSSKFRVYIFKGNIIPVENMRIPDDFGTPVVPYIDVTTHASTGQLAPVKIWDIPLDASLICNDYTIILDCLIYGGHLACGRGKYNEIMRPCCSNIDYRDDLRSTTPIPPSFHVIPETPLGTIAILATMFGGLGCFALRKQRYTRACRHKQVL